MLMQIDKQNRAGTSTQSVSVIVPVYNDSLRLETLLHGLALQSYPAKAFEVIIVDNGSSPALSVDAHRWPFQVRLLREERSGSYVARNTGLRAAAPHSRVIAFTDSDCQVTPDWLENGVRYLSNHQDSADIVAGQVKLIFAQGTPRTWLDHYEALVSFPVDDYVRYFHYGVTANLFVRRDLFELVGAFDDQKFSGGDRDWCQRASQAGASLIYAPEVTIKHPARNELRQLSAKMRRTTAGNFRKGERPECQRRLAAVWKAVRFLLSTRGRWRPLRRVFRQAAPISAKLKAVLIMSWLGIVRIHELLRIAAGADAKRA